jgi:hypothetical protein
MIFPPLRLTFQTGAGARPTRIRNTPTEPPCHTHQVSVVQFLVGAFQTSPPRAEPSRRTAKPEVRFGD